MSNTKLYRLTGQRPMVVPSPGSDWVLSNQFVGLEIEIEAYSRRQINNLLDTSDFWTEKEDHSLRNGTELVLASPLMGIELRTAIAQFFQQVTNYSTGPRTSVHVHINMRQEEDTLEVLRNLCMLYYIYEDAFFQMSDPDRKWCSYCHPFEECPPEPLVCILRGETVDEILNMFERTQSNSARYYGLNLYALLRYGTVEFRHMSGTRDEAHVLRWINLIMELKKAAAALASQGLSPSSVFFNVEDMAKIEELMPVYGQRLRTYTPDVLAYRRLGLASAYLSQPATNPRLYRVNEQLKTFIDKQAAAVPKAVRKSKATQEALRETADQADQTLRELVQNLGLHEISNRPTASISAGISRPVYYQASTTRASMWGVSPFEEPPTSEEI